MVMACPRREKNRVGKDYYTSGYKNVFLSLPSKTRTRRNREDRKVQLPLHPKGKDDRPPPPHCRPLPDHNHHRTAWPSSVLTLFSGSIPIAKLSSNFRMLNWYKRCVCLPELKFDFDFCLLLALPFLPYFVTELFFQFLGFFNYELLLFTTWLIDYSTLFWRFWFLQPRSRDLFQQWKLSRISWETWWTPSF
jgi:hypothetical protein